MTDKPVRVRIAPSPTGYFHVGSARTALFNWLFARHHGGRFIVRVEDTDRSRYNPEAVSDLVTSLRWLGLDWDEGPKVGGNYGPYYQSERLELYSLFAVRLLEGGYAYKCYCSPDRLAALREEQRRHKQSVGYDRHCRNLTSDQRAAYKAEGITPVVRLKAPLDGETSFQDLLHGTITVDNRTLDDLVLLKSDGFPTYHLANVVDDYLMQISHVIRGEEWLPSLPLHALLYKALGWEEAQPIFSHLPLILKPIGKGKLSKRDGDKLGFPVFPLEWKDPKTGDLSMGYKEQGYLPEAFINMLAFLGWNPGTEQEIFSLDELAQAFSLEKVGKAGAKFDPEKTKWFNHQYLVAASNEKVAELFLPILEGKGVKVDNSTLVSIIGLVKERATFVSDLWEQSAFFFEAPTVYDDKVVKKRWKNEVPSLMFDLTELLKSVDDFSSENTEKVVKEWISAKELNMGAVMNAFRLAIVGAGKGPHLFDITAIIGKEETLARMVRALDVLPK